MVPTFTAGSCLRLIKVSMTPTRHASPAMACVFIQAIAVSRPTGHAHMRVGRAFASSAATTSATKPHRSSPRLVRHHQGTQARQELEADARANHPSNTRGPQMAAFFSASYCFLATFNSIYGASQILRCALPVKNCVKNTTTQLSGFQVVYAFVALMGREDTAFERHCAFGTYTGFPGQLFRYWTA